MTKKANPGQIKSYTITMFIFSHTSIIFMVGTQVITFLSVRSD